MTDFAGSTLSSHSFTSGFLFVVGFTFGLSATLLIFGVIIGLFMRPVPRPYARIMETLTIILAITSAICGCAYVAELWIAFYGGNRFELFTILRARGSWLTGLTYFSVFVPQLFWWPRFRKSLLAILFIAIAASTANWFEQLVVFVTKHQDFLPQGWQR
jgi:hypothetical protein